MAHGGPGGAGGSRSAMAMAGVAVGIDLRRCPSSSTGSAAGAWSRGGVEQGRGGDARRCAAPPPAPHRWRASSSGRCGPLPSSSPPFPPPLAPPSLRPRHRPSIASPQRLQRPPSLPRAVGMVRKRVGPPPHPRVQAHPGRTGRRRIWRRRSRTQPLRPV
jgi:hypothetical protein